MPTFSALAGVPLPDDRVIDGEDISAFFTHQGNARTQQFYYTSATSTDVTAYREGDWKVKLPRKGYPKFLDSILKLELYAHDLLLFNLQDDPYEQHNLAQQFPERALQMQQSIAELEKQIEKEGARNLYMRSTGADRKGYGTLMVKAGLMVATLIVLLVAVFYGLYRLIKSRLGRFRRDV
jgi:arylsulfatase A